MVPSLIVSLVMPVMSLEPSSCNVNLQMASGFVRVDDAGRSVPDSEPSKTARS